MSLSLPRRACAAAVTVAAVLVPAAAASAAPANPAVLRVNPTTGTPTRLAGGAPWTTLGGIALGADGRLYVANQGAVGPNPKGAGVYALGAPGFAIMPFASGAAPASVVASGSALYSLDGDSVLRIDGASPTVLTSGGLYDQYGVRPGYGAVSGGTLYTTASSSCASAGGGGSYVIGVDTTTGAQTLVKNLGCTPLGGIAATPSGTLLIAEGGKAPKVVALSPSTGAVTTLSRGGSLEQPRGVALDTAGDLYVADARSGVIAVSHDGGQQSPISDGAAVRGATGIAVAPSGTIYVSASGGAPALKASAASRQRFRRSGVGFTAACRSTCNVSYTAAVKIAGATAFAKSAGVRNVSGQRTVAVRLPGQVNRRIATALRGGRRVTETVTVRSVAPRTGVAGAPKSLSIRLVKP